MATVLDVATYILRKQGQMTTWKLQKLCYYAQAWSLVWDEKPLFTAHIEAWANGPVIPRLYLAHRGRFKVAPDDIGGNPNALTTVQRETVDAVLEHYGDKSSQWLSQLTHMEAPWREARVDLAPGERGHAEIANEAMAEYYESLC